MYRLNKSITEYLIAIKLALDNLRFSKVRTILSILGIVIGVVAVVIVVSAGMGMKNFVMAQIQTFGNDFVEIEVKTPAVSKTSAKNAISQATGSPITTFKFKEAQEIAKMKEIKTFYAIVLGQENVSYEDKSKNSIIMGVSGGYSQVDEQAKLKQGVFFTDDDDKSLTQVVVIGSKLKENLFGNGEALGKYIKIQGKNFKIVGILEERGAVFTFDFDNMLYMPLQTLQKKVMGIDYIQAAIFKPYNPNQADMVAAKMNYEMRRLHNIVNPDKDDFAVTTMKEAQELVGSVFTALNLLLIALTFVSLLVGGVGIMNVMYVAVVERTFEIGLRKAVGASSASIRRQFLFEAVVITFLGVFLGVLIAFLFLIFISFSAQKLGYNISLAVSPMSIILAASFSSLAGIIFGYWPAKKASQLTPVEALRR